MHFYALEGRSQSFRTKARFVTIRAVRKFVLKKLFLFDVYHRKLKAALIYKKPHLQTKLRVSRKYARSFKFIKHKRRYIRRRCKRIRFKFILRSLFLKINLAKIFSFVGKRKLLLLPFLRLVKLVTLNAKPKLLNNLKCLHNTSSLLFLVIKKFIFAFFFKLLNLRKQVFAAFVKNSKFGFLFFFVFFFFKRLYLSFESYSNILNISQFFFVTCNSFFLSRFLFLLKTFRKSKLTANMTKYFDFPTVKTDNVSFEMDYNFINSGDNYSLTQH